MRWENPYLTKIKSESDLPILGCLEPELTTAERALFEEWFGSSDERIVELCTGSGQHLIEQARRSPAAKFFGFELRYKRAFRTIEKAADQSVSNILMIRADARELKDFFPEASLSKVFINFPDPWSRRKWVKNRVLHPPFLRIIAETLKPGGIFTYKTDHQDRFAEVVEMFQEVPLLLLRTTSTDIDTDPHFSDNIKTEFEMLFRSQGKKVCGLIAERKHAVNALS